MKFLTRCAVAVMVLAVFTATAWAEGGQEQRSAAAKPVVNMFMGNSGVPQPSGTDPSDNWAINIVEEYAGVDLVLEIPGYQDFTTKLNLLLASGSLPDVVHGYGAELTKAGDAGAFTNLKPFYDRSGQMQKVVTPVQMDLAKSQVTGRWWAVPMTATGRESGNGSIIRWDLLEQYNGGRFPDTVEGYIDFLRWVKNNVPNSIPLSGQTQGDQLFFISETFFRFYGVTPYGNRIQNGQVVREFTLPTYRAAVETFRKLYAEGILDQEFTNNPSPQFHAKRRERNLAMYTNGIDQILPITDYFLTNPQEFGSYYVYVPRLREYPIPSSELKYLAASKSFPIISHRVAIAESSKQKDAAWRVLEGFASPELREAQAWGREGKEYNVVNGQRVPTDRLYMNDPNDADSHYWTLHLGIIWGFWPTDVKYAIQEQRVGKDIWTRVHDSADWLRSGAEERGISPFNFTGPLPDVDAKEGEAVAFISQAIAKAITGEIDMVGFDGQVAEFKRRYGFMDEARTKALMARKDELLSYGAYEIGW